MTTIIMAIEEDAALFTNPDSDEAQAQNLLLNMMGGLSYEDPTTDELKLLVKMGYTMEDYREEIENDEESD